MKNLNLIKMVRGFVFSVIIISGISFAQDKTVTNDFTVKPGGTLEVAVAVGDVFITPGPGSKVEVRVIDLDEDDLDDYSAVLNGNTVTVRLESNGWSNSDAEFYIKIPSQFNINIHTAAGDIIVRENLDGTAEMKTSGGDIKLGAVNGTAKLHTSGGDIKVGNVLEKLEASTAGGDIDVGVVGGDAELKTAGGDIMVKDVKGSVKMKTAGGDIQCGGATGTVEAITAGGDIVLKDISGSIKAKTAAGDIVAYLNPSGKGSSVLKTSVGDIKIVLPATAKATLDVEVVLDTWFDDDEDDFDVIRSDWKPESIEKVQNKRKVKAKYVINGGGEKIELSTVMGNVRIIKAK